MTDPQFDEQGQPQNRLEQITITFLCPPGFDPKAFLITALNQQGQSYTNAPMTQPHVALRLGTMALDFVSQHATIVLQKQIQERSPILQVPAGAVPTWNGPEGRS